MQKKKQSMAYEKTDDPHTRRKERERERGTRESEWYGHSRDGSGKVDNGKGELKRRERRRSEAMAAIEVLEFFFCFNLKLFHDPDYFLAW